MVKNITDDQRWYLLYTNPRAEKKVKTELDFLGYEVFLPVQKICKQWSDRKKWVEEPLFKSYLFVKTNLEKNFYSILNVHGVVKFVNFERKPVVVQERDIKTISILLGNFSDLEAVPYTPQVGDEVEIISGAMAGYRAKLLHANAQHQVYLELPEIMHSIRVNIPLKYIKPLTTELV